MKIRVIVNPKAGALAGQRKARELDRALLDHHFQHETAVTERPGDATELARRAIADGVEVLIVVGGDGTLNEVAQAYATPTEGPLPRVALVAAGTGGDFARLLYPEKPNPRAVVGRLEKGNVRLVDLGLLELVTHAGRVERRAFLNIASCGVSGKIDALVNRSPKWLGGRLAFATGTVRALTTYKNPPVTIDVDGVRWFEGRTVVAAIANGQYFGGGMHIAPFANPFDGRLGVVVVGDLSFGENLRAVPSLYAGTHLSHPRVKHTTGTRIHIAPASDIPVEIDVDGEALGRLPITATLLPGRVPLL